MSPFGTHTCLKDGKFVLLGEIDVVNKTYIQKWKSCDGICIEATKNAMGHVNYGCNVNQMTDLAFSFLTKAHLLKTATENAF